MENNLKPTEDKFYIFVDTEIGTLHDIGDKDKCMNTYKRFIKGFSGVKNVNSFLESYRLPKLTTGFSKCLKVYEVPNIEDLWECFKGTCDYFKSKRVQDLIEQGQIKSIIDII